MIKNPIIYKTRHNREEIILLGGFIYIVNFAIFLNVPSAKFFEIFVELHALHCDQLERREDGTIRVTRQLKRKIKKTDANEERLALLRVATKSAHLGEKVEVALHSLQDGELQIVPENRRYEPNRVEKYNKSLAELKAGDFEPNPEKSKCAECPWFFLCPS